MGNGAIEAPPPPPPPPPAPIRISSGIKAPQKIRHVDPIYSSIAQAAKVLRRRC